MAEDGTGGKQAGAGRRGRGTGEGGKEKMKNEHWIQGDNLCEAPLFRRSFFLEEIPGRRDLRFAGWGIFCYM